MPPQISFTKERILKQALDIIRKEGIGALSARKIAQSLNCSTRPVYSAFNSMKALQEAAIQHAREYALNYFLQNQDSNSPFLQMGLRYFRFSQEEKELFNLLYLKGGMGNTFEKMGQPFAPLLDLLKQDPSLENLNQDSLKRIGVNMWIYTHGLIALMYTNPPDNAEDFVRTYLYQMGKTLIESEYNKRP